MKKSFNVSNASSTTYIPNEMSISANNIPLNTYQNIQDSSYIVNKTKINKGKRVVSQKQISKNNSSKMNNIKNLQKNSRQSMKNRNSKLTSINY